MRFFLKNIKNSLAFFSLFFIFSSSYSQIHNDLQLWTNFSVSKKIKDINLSITEEVRFFQNISEVEEFYTDFGLEYKISKRFYCGFNYRLKFNHTYINQLQNSHRFNFDIKYKFSKKRFDFYYRFRIQSEIGNFSFMNDENSSGFKIRNKFNIQYDIKNLSITPFVAIEPYTDVLKYDLFNISKLRLTAGLEFEKKMLKGLSVYYRLEKSYSAKFPKNDYIIGLVYAFDF